MSLLQSYKENQKVVHRSVNKNNHNYINDENYTKNTKASSTNNAVNLIDFKQFSDINMELLIKNNHLDILQQNLDNLLFTDFASECVPMAVRRYHDDHIKSFRICQLGLKERMKTQEALISELNHVSLVYTENKE